MSGLNELAQQVGEQLLLQHKALAVAESCTGGWVAKCLTDVAGGSLWFDRGFVTYSNAAKQAMLGVSGATLDSAGAVSEQTVREMVAGALENSEAGVALAVSGIAGPGGGMPGKPVGTVCFAWAVEGSEVRSETRHFEGDREAVRRQSVGHALQGLLDVLGQG
jgi:nicotinamide-nucleotide amidase